MTLIVYDNQSLITDSMGKHPFDGSADYTLSYHANKILLNPSKTIAYAYCGEVQDQQILNHLWKSVEADMVLQKNIWLLDQPLTPRDDKVIRGAIQVIRQYKKDLKFSPSEYGNGIAISRQHALSFSGSGTSNIGPVEYNGHGCYPDAYWLLRRGGKTPVEAFRLISDWSTLVGGKVNIQTQIGLEEIDHSDYLIQLGNVGGPMADIWIKALQPKQVRPKTTSTTKKKA